MNNPGKKKKGRREAADAPLCPCGSGVALSACCGRWLSGGASPLLAPDPLSLMRSRFTAYALGDDAYVLATWAPETRPTELFGPGEPRPKWVSLRILSSSVSPDGRTGEVEFLALARTSQGAVRMREHSRFRREPDGRWVYVEGDQLDPAGAR